MADGKPGPLATRPAPGALAGRVAALEEQTRRLLVDSVPENTKRAYQSGWKHWTAWAEAHGERALPADPRVLGLYLTDSANNGDKLATLRLRLAAIRAAHMQAGYKESPTRTEAVRLVIGAIARKHGSAQEGKDPIRLADLQRILAKLPPSLKGLRDRAVLLLGFAGALRRSEIAAVRFEHLRRGPGGLVLTIPRSKTDQTGEGQKVGIPEAEDLEVCPVEAIARWLNASGITSGPLFRAVDRHGNVALEGLTDKAVANIVKESLTAVGIDPARYGGHSLRVGLATEAGARGVEERVIAKQTRHRDLKTLRKYIREGDALRAEGNAAALVIRGPAKTP